MSPISWPSSSRFSEGRFVNRRDFAQLFKFPISIMSTVSAATGYVAFTHALTWRLLAVSGVILLLAFCACALNEAQEYKLDALRLHVQDARPHEVHETSD